MSMDNRRALARGRKGVMAGDASARNARYYSRPNHNKIVLHFFILDLVRTQWKTHLVTIWINVQSSKPQKMNNREPITRI